MAEAFYDLDEFSKRMVEIFRPFFKGYDEYVIGDVKVYKFTGKYANVDISLGVYRSKEYEQTTMVIVDIIRGLDLIAKNKIYVRTKYVSILSTIRLRYRERYVTYMIDEGYSGIPSDELKIEVNKKLEQIVFSLYG